jgi:hypothetical protein
MHAYIVDQMSKYHQGKFRPINPSKYKGDVSNIVYRSSWELKALLHFDKHPDILQYSSEEVIVPYVSPIDGKRHRYFVDMWLRKRNKDGSITECLIEIKPKAQCKPPEAKTGKPTKRYINEVYTWGVNKAKWDAAESYCKQRGWTFIILTEDQLNIK